VHGGASASTIPSDGAVEGQQGSQDIQQDELSGYKDATEVEESQKGPNVNNVAVRQLWPWQLTCALCSSCRFQRELGSVTTSQDGNAGSAKTSSVCLL
jgi:hypothetical protein